MNIIKSLFKAVATAPSFTQGAIPYGKIKQDGSHDHRYNCGDDRTPAQKNGDQKKKSKHI